MKNLVLSMCLITTAADANPGVFFAAQPCNDGKTVIDSRGYLEEQTLFTAQIDQTNRLGDWFSNVAILQVNQQTGTWSLISVWGDGIACIVASGGAFEPYSE